jgi:hypothetical protein
MRQRCAVALIAALLATPARAGNFGDVELVTGQVTLQTQDGRVLQLRVGDVVPDGVELLTGKDGELHIATEDGGYVALRPGTRLRVAEYRAEGDDLDTQVLSLLRGSFRSITGWIGKHNAERYKITTPTATIGVRGTDHEPSYLPQDDEAVGAETPAGTYDKVNEGASYIENQGGRVEIRPNQSGYAPPGRATPQRLRKVPQFFRATANEHRILVRREELRKIFEKRRSERREALKARFERLRGRRDGHEERGQRRN